MASREHVHDSTGADRGATLSQSTIHSTYAGVDAL